MPNLTESTVEEATIAWFQELGYSYEYGPDIAFGELLAERKGRMEVV